MGSRRARGRSVSRSQPSSEPERGAAEGHWGFGAILEAVRALGTRAGASARRAPAQRKTAANTKRSDVAAMTADPGSEDSELRAWAVRLGHMLPLPVDGIVIGQPVEVTTITYDGNVRRGLQATCRHGEELHTVSLADVYFPPGPAAEAVSLFRQWLDQGTALEAPAAGAPSSQRHEADQIELGSPVDLVVLARQSNALRCRLAGTEQRLTLRTADRQAVPGEIITVTPTKSWSDADQPCLTGTIESSRLDAEALGLTPPGLRALGDWNPEEEDWRDEDAPIEDWAQPILARGPRPSFEMVPVPRDTDPEDFDSDPICRAVELRAAGDDTAARDLLMHLLAADLRYLDAHAHLGTWEFGRRPKVALRHYAVGVDIAALTLGHDFDGVLPWGFLYNRPFLRCMQGLGISLWKLGHMREAAAVFHRMLWLNPTDNQGARFNLAALAKGQAWR